VPIEVPQNGAPRSLFADFDQRAVARGKGMPEKLANELNDAANLRGGAIKKRDDVHAWRKPTRPSRITGGKVPLPRGAVTACVTGRKGTEGLAAR